MLNNDSLRKSLNYAFLKSNVPRDAMDVFKIQAAKLINSIQENETEEFHKNSLSDFLKDTYYKSNHYINTKGRNDLVIHNEKTANSSVGVMIEVKSPSNTAEMVSCDNLNKKALQELVLYYLRERITHKNLHIKHLIITNINDWFIFDARIFESCFAENKQLVKDFSEFEKGTLAGHKTKSFYDDIAKPVIETCKAELSFTHFNLPDYKILLEGTDNEKDKELIPLFKVLSPEHLLKLSFSNDANSLNQEFYNELLHLIGLEEVKESGKKLIKRKKESERNYASLLEQSIKKIKSRGEIIEDDLLFEMAIELSITWINRILFLKLLEAQLLSYHQNDKAYQFFNSEKLTCFSDLNHLFFEVLALSEQQRDELTRQQFSHVPYLNSSLFERTELEAKTLDISVLRRLILPILSSTVLKDERGKKLMGELDILTYLFSFLEAYDFGNDSKEAIKSDNKSLITASALGLIFEKINGYKDGSFFTPSVITMYMSRETLRLAVLQKFNQEKGWSCQNFEELYNQKKDLKEANAIINSLKICDPAVGSGHFLVSVLNEIIAIKSELAILADSNGKRILYNVAVINDELKLTHENDEAHGFIYYINSKESRRIQETLFHEKQTIIENCLFGVDINPNSVKICRLRLWIELLKSAYYKDDGKLETLPNIDINIQVGNSLISRFPLDADLKTALKRSNVSVEDYKNAFRQYQNAKSKPEKKAMEHLIKTIKENFYAAAYENNPNIKLLSEKIAAKNSLMNISVFEETDKEKAAKAKAIQKVELEIARISAEIENFKNNKLYENAFEWRFEFPEALDDNGDFIGFDVIIGNPPYIKEYTNKSAFDGIRNLSYYQGKMDLWYFFACLSVDLLKEKTGILNFIATNNWTTNSGASKLRNKMIKDTEIKQLIDFSSYMIFESADIQTMIMMAVNDNTKDNYTLDYRRIKSQHVAFNNILDILNKNKTEDNELLQPVIKKDSFLDKVITFSNNAVDIVLEKIQQQGSNFLNKDEVANGIHPHHDYVNKKSQEILGDKFHVGQGIFVLNTEEKKSLNLNKKELQLLKPYYTTKQLSRWFGSSKNAEWIIYTGSEFKEPDNIKPYPNLEKHLDQFQAVITSDNKPYGLHRSRKESFFKGEKIIALRKCVGMPIFTYTNFDCYVSATFYVIKTDRTNQKYLTAFLNSKLIAFWLKNKGKMQGNNYQIDKEPLLDIPIYNANEFEQQPIIELVDKVLTAKKSGKETHDLETQIDKLVYELYGLTADEIKIIEGEK